MMPTSLELIDVGRVIDGNTVLRDVTWAVEPSQRWIVLGRNGSGKSTLIRIASLYLHPTTGTVRVLGETLGQTDVRTLRTRVGLMSAALGEQFRGDLTATEVVMTAKHAALEPWWHSYDDADRGRAVELLISLRCAGLLDRKIATLSSGERQRVLVARSLMTSPGLVLLDEPTASLDLGGREELVGSLSDLAADPVSPPIVLVTHHVEEIPHGFTHVLMMKAGRIVASGEVEHVLNADALSDCFEIDVDLDFRNGRWIAFAKR